jgi:hypothetical protein
MGQFFGRNPVKVLASQRFDLTSPDGAVVKIQHDRAVRIRINRFTESVLDHYIHTEFFHHLTLQAVLKGLTRKPFASWKLPHTAKHHIMISLCDQVTAVLTDNGRSHFDCQIISSAS